MKVLFINVSKYWEGRVYKEYPYGLGILATLTENAGHSVHILDMAVDKTSYEFLTEKFAPDVIALSFMSMSINVASSLIKSIKENFTGHLISGGIHTSLYPEDMVKKGVDISLIGEGEYILIKLLDLIQASNTIPGRYDALTMGSIPDIVYRDINGKIIRNITDGSSVELNDLPIMNRNLFKLDLYSHHSILTSRGCPYRCKFCCSWAPGGKSGRIMSPEKIIRELEFMVKMYGDLELYWADEIFFWTSTDRLDFCKKLKDIKLPIKFTIQLRADLISEELIDALLEVGCNKLCIGAESGSDSILSTANKHILSLDIERALNICAKRKLRTKTWWMIGLPGGNKDEQLSALDIIERTRPNEVAVHQFVPLPGTEFWNCAEDYGINLPNEDNFDKLSYYGNVEDSSFNYFTSDELYIILKEYERRLTEMGYVPTDIADEKSEYVFTTPFQQNTFKI